MTDSTDEILAQRGKTHGDYSDHALVTQNLKSQMQLGKNWDDLNPEQKEALEMIQHKVGRILSGNPNFRDHWDDIAGYARLVADRCPNGT
jgi:hypothetical protein